MNKTSTLIASAVLAVLGASAQAQTAAPVAASAAQSGPAEMRQDAHDIRHDRRGLKQDRQDATHDRAELKQDRAQRQTLQRREDKNLAKGHTVAAERIEKKRETETREIKREKRDLGHDKKDITHDKRERAHDMKKRERDAAAQ